LRLTFALRIWSAGLFTGVSCSGLGQRQMVAHELGPMVWSTMRARAGAINGIESVKRNAPNAEIDDQTDK
jgi:hypothetical protein